MILQNCFLILLSIISIIIPKYLCGKLEPIGSNFLKPYASNKGEETFYKFEFLPENEILKNAKIQIQFPQEYTIYDFSDELECSSSIDGNEYNIRNCEYLPGHIIEIDIETVYIIETQIIIGMITNPTAVSSSSQFRMMSYYNDVLIDSNQGFGYVSFSKVPGTINSPSVTIISNQRISEGSTYEFRFTSSSNYYGRTTVRFTFPDGFTSQSAMCDIQNLVGINPTTKIFHNKRIIGCIKAQKDILNTEVQVVKIINMVNPDFKGDFDGFKIEIMDGDSSIILEKIEYPAFSDSITILPGELSATYYAEQPFKLGTLDYGFQINLVNRVDSNGRLYLNFTSDWTMIDETCEIISGVNMLPDKNATCTLIDQAYAYRIEDFESIGPETQIVVQMKIQTPPVENTYPVEIGTYNGLREAQIDYKVIDIAINATYGVNEVWRAHPIRSPVTLRAGETGPLEIIFFLKTELLKTNVGTFGKFRIDIFPAIPIPDPDTYGSLKCFFYANIPSDDCTFVPTSHAAGYTGEKNADNIEKTVIQMKTPLDYSFKESEIPLTITTQGAQPGEPTGLKLDKIVKRYVFQIHMFTADGLANQDINTDTPVEFYFTEFVPAPYDIDAADVSCTLHHQTAQQYTHMTIDLTQNVIDDFEDEYEEWKRNYKLRIRFSNQNYGWDRDSTPLGWDNDIYFEYPCVISGTMINSAQKLRCDLYSIGQNENVESFIDVYGFHTQHMTQGSTLKVEIPHLKLGSNANEAFVDVMIAEETPGMRDDIVVFAIRENVSCGTVSSNTIGTATATSSADDSLVNKAPVFTWTFNSINAGADFIYVFVQGSDTDFPEMAITGGILGDDLYEEIICGSHTCRLYGDVLKQIHIFKSGQTLTSSETVTIPNTVFTNPPYEDNWTFSMRVIQGNQVTDYDTFTIAIDAEEMTTAAFAKVDTTLHYNTEHVFSVSFTTVNPLPDDGAIRFVFSGVTTQETEHTHCEITNLTQLDDSGIQCYSTSTSTFIVDNIAAVPAGTAITVKLKVKTTTNTTPSVSITTYYQIARNNRVDYKNGVTSASLTFSKEIMGKFEIMNPAIIDEVPQAGYAGKLEFYYQPTVDYGSTYDLYVYFYGYSLPSTGQPLYCYVDSTQRACYVSSSSNPLTIYFDNPSYINTSTNHHIEITTEEASPQNGIIFPTTGGIYRMETYWRRYLSSQNYYQLSNEYYIINPPVMKYTNVEFLHNSANQRNIFTIKFQISSDVNAYNSGDNTNTDNGRIFIEFQRETTENDGFADDLGGYSDTGDKVGCYVVAGLVAEGSDPVSCLLIKATLSGQPTYVEIINFDALSADDEISIMIANVYNPVNTVENVKIGILTFEYNGTDGSKTYLNYGQHTVFLNSKTVTPNGDSTHPQALGFEAGATVAAADQNLENIIWYDNQGLAIADYVIVELPDDLSIAAGDNGTCDATKYDGCYNFHDINWVVFKLKTALNANTQQDAHLQCSILPQQVAQSDQTVIYYIFAGQEYIGRVLNTISQANYRLLNTDFTSPSVDFIGHSGKHIADRDMAEYIVQFTLKSPVPEGGTIEISFPADFQVVYPNCRSAINNGNSELYSLAGDNVGDIGCEVQSARRWVITGFKAIDTGAVVEIYGHAKNVATGGSMQPDFEIRTYADTHSSDIYTNGQIISQQDSITLGTAIVDTPPLFVKDTYTFLQTDYLQPNYVGPFKLQAVFSQNVDTDVTIKLWRNQIYSSSNVGDGFQTESATVQDELVCYFVDGDRNIGCTIAYSTGGSGQQSYIQYVLTPDETLNSSQEYIIVITTMNKQVAATQNGIQYPTAAGIYKVEISADSVSEYQSLFLEVYPTPFTTGNFESYNYAAGRENYLDLEVQPSVNLDTDDLLVIEINTASPSGATYFEDGSVTYNDYDNVLFDLVDNGSSAVTSVTCKYFQGQATTKTPMKIVCTDFNSAFTSSITLRFIFEIKHSDVATASDHFYVPVSVYTYDVSLNKKLNYQFFDQRMYVKHGTVTDVTNVDPVWTLDDTDMGATATFGLDTPVDMTPKDSLILKFDNYLASNSNVATVGSVGTVIYCKTIQAIIILPTADLTASTITLGASHDNEGSLRTTEQRIAFAYNNFYTSKTTTIYDFTAYPLPQLTFSTATGISAFTVALKHSEITEHQQYNDLVFSVTSNNFESIKRIAILTTDLSTFNSFTCQVSSGSEIEVAGCYIETQTSTAPVTYQILNIDIFTNSFTADKDLIVETRNFLHENLNASVDLTNWIVKALYWDGSAIPGDLQPWENDDYALDTFAGTGALNPWTTVVDKPQNNYFEIPYERYIQEVLTYSTSHTFPIEFDYTIPVALTAQTGSDYNELLINYPSDMTIANTVQYTTDILEGRPWCHINNVYQICEIDDSAKTVLVKFQDAYSVSDVIHVRLSQINPRTYPENEGFKWTSTTNNLGKFVVELTKFGVTPKHITILNPINMFLADSSNLDFITDITVTNQNTFSGNYNYINVDFTLAASGVVDYIVVEIDTVGIYTSGSMHGLTSGEMFPCSVGTGMTSSNIICIFEEGSTTDSNIPQKIYISNFSLTASSNTQGSFNLVIKNPDETVPQNFSITLKAYGGTASGELFTGTKFYGQKTASAIFATIADNEQTYTDSVFKPNSILTLQGDIVIDNPAGNSESIDINTKSLLYIPVSLDKSTHPIQMPCTISGLTSVEMNYIEVSGELYAFVAIEHAAAVAAGGTITVGKFTCQYYSGNWKIIHLSVDTATKISVYTAEVDLASVQTLGAITIADHAASEVEFYGQNVGSFGYISVTYDLSALNTFLTTNSISYDTNQILTIDLTTTGTLFLDTSNDVFCSALSGVTNGSSSSMENIGCAVDGSNKFKITLSNFDAVANSITILYSGNFVSPSNGAGEHTIVVSLYSRSQSTYPIAESASFELSLPTYATPTNTFASVTQNTDLTYDSSTNTITWDVSLTSSANDYFTAADETFKVAIVFENFNSLASGDVSSATLTMTDSTETCSTWNVAYSDITVNGIAYKSITFENTTPYTCLNSVTWAGGEARTLQFSIAFNDKVSKLFNYEFQYVRLQTYSAGSVVDEQDFLYYIRDVPSSTVPTIVSLGQANVSQYSELKVSFTPNYALSSTGYRVLLEFVSIDWGTELVYGTGTTEENVEFPCMCGTTNQICVRHQKIASQTEMAISIKDLTESAGNLVECYIPGVIVPGIASQDIYLKLVNNFNARYSTESQFGTKISHNAVINIPFAQTDGANAASIDHSNYTGQVNSGITSYSIDVTSKTNAISNVVIGAYGKGIPTWTGDYCGGLDNECRKHGLHNGIFFVTGQASASASLSITGGTATAQNYGPSDVNIMVNTFDVSYNRQDSATGTLTFANPSIATPTITMKANALKSSNIEDKESVYIINASINNLANFNGNSLLELTIPAGSGVQTISKCYAFEADRIDKLKCEISGSGSGPWTINVSQYDISTNTIVSGDTIQIYVPITNPTADIDIDYVIYQDYDSASSFEKYGENSMTSYTIDTSYNGQTIENQSGSIKFYDIRPKIFGSTYTPFRIFFDLNGLTLDNSEIMEFNFGSDDTGYDLPSGTTVKCYIREYQSTGIYQDSVSNCAYAAVSNEYVLSVPQPNDFNFSASAAKYEIILATDDITKFGISNFDLLTKYKFDIDKSGTILTYQQGHHYAYQRSDITTISKLYYSSERQSTTCYIYLEFAIQAGRTQADIPTSQLELEFVNTNLPAGLTVGDAIDCQLSGFTDASVTPYTCIVSERAGSGNLVVSIENALFTSGSNLSIAFENIVLDTVTSFTDFTVNVSYLKTDKLYYKQFKALFMINPSSTDSSSDEGNEAMDALSNTNHSADNINYDVTFSWPQTTNTYSNDKGNKIVYKFTDTDGPFSVRSNSLTSPPTFYYGANTGSLASYNLLYKNEKTGIFVFQSFAYTSGNNVVLRLDDLDNPHFSERGTYGSAPEFDIEIYAGHNLGSYLKVQYPADTDFTIVAASNTVNLSSYKSYGWYDNQVFILQVDVSLSSLSTSIISNESLSYVTLNFDTANTVLLDCAIMSSDHNFNVCTLESSTKLKISGLQDQDPSNTITVYVYTTMQANSQQVTLKVFSSSDTEFMSNQDTDSVGNYSGSQTLITNVQPLHRKFLNDMFEIQETILYQSSTPQYLQFIYTQTAPLVSSDSDVLEITLDDGADYIPTTSTDKDLLNCYFFKQFGTYSYDFDKPIISTCAYSDSDPYVYTLDAPVLDLAAGTYLVRIEVDRYGTTQTFNYPTEAKRNEILFTESYVTATTEKTDTVILNAKYEMTTATIEHTSLTKQYYDYMKIDFTPSNTVPVATAPAEMNLVIELDSNQYGDKANYDNVFSDASLSTYKSGDLVGVEVKDSNDPDNLILKNGDTTKNQHFKYVYPLHSVFTSATSYYIRIPKLKVPNSDINLNTKVYIEQCPDLSGGSGAVPYCFINTEYNFISHAKTETNTPSTMTVILQEETNVKIQSTDLELEVRIYNHGNNVQTDTYTILEWDNSEVGIPEAEWPNFTAATHNVVFFKYLNIHLVQRISSTTASNYYITQNTGINAQDYESNVKLLRVEMQYQQQTIEVDESITALQLDSVGGTFTQTFTRIDGKNGYTDRIGCDAQFQFRVTNSVLIPEGSRIEIELQNGISTALTNAGYNCQPGENFFAQPGKSLDCYRTDTSKYILKGFQEIAKLTDFDIKFYAQQDSAGTNVRVLVNIYDSNSNLIQTIQSSDLIIYDVNNDQVSFDYSMNQIEEFIYAEQRSRLQFKANIEGSTVTSFDHFIFNMPTQDVDGTAGIYKLQDTNAIQRIQYKESGNDYWVNSDFTDSHPVFDIAAHADYPISESTDYTITMLTTEENADANNVLAPVPSLYRFIGEVYDSTGSTVKELSYEDFLLKPQRDTTLSIIPIFNYRSTTAIIRAQYTLQEDLQAGDEIWLEFVTHNGLSRVFDDDLGFSSTERDCINDQRTISGITKINSSTVMDCGLVYGGGAIGEPAIVKIKPDSTASAGDTFRIYVSPVQNPANGRKSSVILTHRRQCRSDGYMCVLSESSDFYTPTTNIGSARSCSVSVGKVLEQGVTHSYDFNTNVASSEYVFIKQSTANHTPTHLYTPNTSCTGDDATNDLCLTFPLSNFILYSPGSNKSTGQFNINGMNNGFYRYSANWYLYIVSSTGTSYDYASTAVTYDWIDSTMTVNVTQSAQDYPNYQRFVRDFDNIFEINVAQTIWPNRRTYQYTLEIPDTIDYIVEDYRNTGVSVDGKYCNATYVNEESTNQNVPYPPRFRCKATSNKIQFKSLAKSTEDLDGWDTPYADFTLRIYFSGHIDINQASGTSNNIVVKSFIETTTWDPSDNLGIAQATATFDVSPIDLPDLNMLTFNTLSFYDRKARLGDKIEYYMLLEPKTQTFDYVIDKWVFRLPEEFDYPNVLNLDQCEMIGKVTDDITDCTLNRQDRNTYVTAIPVNYGDHAIKIVRLSFETEAQLFTAPVLPGDHYNISLAMYEGDTLVEKTDINMTDVLGVFFDVNLLSVDLGLDPETLTMFQFDFVIGDYDVQAGYNIESTTIWSRIHFIFESKYGYENDLGTGFQQGQEFGCVVKEGLTTQFTGRLKCEIDLGTNPEDLPTIIVSGYDKIASATAIKILVTGIKTLPDTKRVDIKIGIELIYNYLGGISAFIYEPTPPPLPAATNSANNIADSGDAMTVSVTGDSEVLGVSDYTFTLTNGATDITTDDYIALQFPDDFFEKYSDFSGVTCDEGGNTCTPYVFGLSNMIYVQPSVTISGGATVTFTIFGLKNPAYSLSETVQITGFTKVGGPQNRVQETRYVFTLNRDLDPCSIFTEAASVADSYIGGQNDVTFQVDFITGHPVPTWGAVSVTFPDEYDINLLSLGASCAPKDFDLSNSEGNPYCKIGTAKRVDLYLNGYELDQITRYSIEIFGVTTLNIETSDLKFSIASYYYDNIYLQRKICEKEFLFPSLKPVSVKTCDMISESQYKNVEQLSIYTFQLQCKEPIRKETELQILVPKEFAKSNGVPKNFECSSKETTTLEEKTCQLKYNSNGNLILYVQLQQIESQKRFTVLLKLNNPKVAKSDYQFSANLYSKSLLYLQAPVQNKYVPIESNEDTKEENPDLLNMNLINIPKNAGEKSTYIFTIPPHKQPLNSVTQFDIKFPNTQKNIYQPLVFDANIGDNLQCSVYIDTTFDQEQFTYHSLLELTSTTEGQQKIYNLDGILIPLECGVTTDRTLTIYDIDLLKEYDFQDYWYSYFIRNVHNPSEYVQGDEFELQYLKDSKISWSVKDELKYYVSEPTELMKMKEITISDNNIKNPADYTFTVSSSEDFYYMADMAISITLPDLYSDVITYQENTMTCNVNLDENNTIQAKCALYTYEILLWDLQLMSIDTQEIEISISKIINPIIEISCTDEILNDNYYTVKLINLLSDDIQYSTSPSIDDKNCLEFVKGQFNIVASGPSVVQPGLSYVFQLQLEQPADGLKITPVSTVNGIKFNPTVVEFDNFKETIKEFKVIVRTDVLPGNYWLTFESQENEGDNFYLPILPFQLQVIDFDNGVNSQPIIEVGDFEQDSIGFPIICPVYISDYVANAIDFLIELKDPQQSSFITINPQRITIDNTMLQTSFEIIIDTNVVPESVTLQFSISSFYPTMHQVVPAEKTLKFSRNLNSNTDFPSLTVIFSEIFIETDPNELDQTVLWQSQKDVSSDSNGNPIQSIDIQKEQVKPIIYSKQMQEIQANQATIEALITQKSTVYYVLAYQGSVSPTQEQLLQKTYKYSLGYGSVNTNTVYDINIDYQSIITLTGLSGQANYEVHMMASNALGYSDIVSINFKTSILSYGVVVKIPLREYVTEEQIITALSKTLRITEDRLIIMRQQNQLIQELDDYSELGDIMINPNLYYEIAIAPNAESDVIQPIELANYLNMEQYIDQLDQLLPQFDETREITNRQIRQTSPKIQIEPYQKDISYYSAEIGLRLWEQGKVFGIIIESDNVTDIPYSNQIFRGDNEINEPISHYRKFSALSEEDGSTYLYFDDLIDNTDYTVFLTVGNNLPYEPLMLYDDDKVRQLKFKTPININLQYNSASLEAVRVANTELADALEKRYTQ